MNKYKTFENEFEEENSSCIVETEHIETTLSPVSNPANAAIIPQVTSSRTVGQSRFIENVPESTEPTVIISDPAELNSTDADIGYVILFYHVCL